MHYTIHTVKKLNMSLLPSNYSEFRSKQYWDEFFMQRDQRPFEWYVAAVKDILPLLKFASMGKVFLHLLNIVCCK